MRKHVAFSLTILICFHSSEAVFASDNTANQDLPADLAKAAIERLGVGERVTVTLRYAPQIKGFISHIYPDAFELANLKGGGSTRIPYSDVSKVKKGTGWQTGTKILIGVVTFIAVFVLLMVVNDPS